MTWAQTWRKCLRFVGGVGRLGVRNLRFRHSHSTPSYTKVDTEECMCPVDGVEVWIKRANGNDEPVTVNDGKFSTAVLIDEQVTLYLKSYYGVEGTSDCTAATNGSPLDHEGHELHCIEVTDAHGVKQLADVRGRWSRDLPLHNATPVPTATTSGSRGATAAEASGRIRY